MKIPFGALAIFTVYVSFRESTSRYTDWLINIWISAMRQKLHRILRKECTKSTTRHNVFVCQDEILSFFSMICKDQNKIPPAKALNCCSFFLSFKFCLRKRGKNKMCSNGRAVCHHKTCLLKAQFPLIRWQLQKQNVHTDA